MSLLVILVFLSLVALGIGQVKPGWVLPWGSPKTRGRAALTYGVSAVVCLLIASLSAPVPRPIYPEDRAKTIAQPDKALPDPDP